MPPKMEYLQQYEMENLRATLAELQTANRAKDVELGKLREWAEAAQELQAGEAQGAKIIELAKKNRALLLSLEKERQRSTELQAALRAGPVQASPAKDVDPDGVEERARAFVERAVAAAEGANKDALMWKDRCLQQTNKIAQLEQKVFAQEIEHKKVVRALVREVGEETPLSKVLEEGSDWKGRREQLIALRDQVKALKSTQGLATDGRHEAAAKKAISKISGQRSAEMDRLAAECGAVKQELEAVRGKCDAAVSRRKVVEAEMASLKEKVAVVLDKSVNDSRLIAALRAEVAAAELRGSSKSGSSSTEDVISDNDLWARLGQLQRKVDQQEDQIDKQERIILMLQGSAAGDAHQGSIGGGGSLRARLAEVENAQQQQQR